ncbi:hypothetical protein F0344_15845 [Streptomyces finlayi]|uniref:Uncharacterized protein n=1 Tax=Streptomyces finlayi TaxID=67296 RepID=A0A7G7BKP7_9ACTN|nr:hypothetical protein [Streptomyces finlayi]QNE75912.1 hypothetical protein F0344_15845 [Streptomyces finlayi]
MTEPTEQPAVVDQPAVTAEPAPAASPVPEAPATLRPPRRVLRAVARWTAAVLVCGGLGTGTSYGIASMERTDVPGLATEGDGRWAYPELALPALPSGAPRPLSYGNVAGVHHADLRELLLPVPDGATPDKKLTGGWVTPAQYASEYRAEKRAELTGMLRDSTLRHIAARGWTMPDGTESRIYLLRFNSTAYAEAFRDDLYVGATAGLPLAKAPDTDFDESWKSSGRVHDTVSYVFEEKKPFGKEHVRQAYTVAGDTVALIVHSRDGEAASERIPFHQSVILQNQLLG